MNKLREQPILLLFLSVLLMLASTDFCLHRGGDHVEADRTAGGQESAAPGVLLHCDCDAAGHHNAHSEDHREGCASCLCLCHVSALLELAAAAPVPSPLRASLADPAISPVLDFKSGIERPPLLA